MWQKAAVRLLLFAFIMTGTTLAVDSKKAKYVGGTVSTVKEATEGTLSIADEKDLNFTARSSKLLIPYDKINSLEYRQKAGRRVGVAIMVSPIDESPVLVMPGTQAVERARGV